ncbi:MAG: hypothetical protein D6748_05610 [Calditrichaeota bacterium]|nr:MAG: hypothetical protein D6748_05610 [Calditrichota bacterium]
MKYLWVVGITVVLLTSCSLQRIALKTTTGLFAYGVEALYAEPDLELAKTAIASNLKLLEGFHRADPNNKELLLFLTQGYASYSLAFLEDTDPKRASAFYLRARDYGFQLLQKSSPFKKGIPQTEAEFKEKLTRLKKSDVPALFWAAFAWSGWINLNRDKPQAVFDLNIVKAMMNRVLELDEGYFFGGAHLFWGSILGSIPPMLGGNPEKAKQHFQRALELSDGKFLMTFVYYARFYAAPTLNEELFDSLLDKVISAKQDILPNYELMTSLAKQKARWLATQKEELF